MVLITSCTNTKNLTYLNNLLETAEPQYFPHEKPDYRVQYRDILYIDVKALTTEGKIENIMQGSSGSNQTYIQGEANQYLIGYIVDKQGHILLPGVGKLSVAGKSLPEIQRIVQGRIDSVFNHAFVDVKLLSFKYTVLGEVRTPGSFINYNDYLTVLDAIGHAGGVSDYGRRDRVLVVRSIPEGSKTYRIDLQNKDILTSEAYFLMPNDVIIIEPVNHKIFNMNLPTISFALSSITGAITTTLLLINYFNNK